MSRRRCSVIALVGVVALVAANEDGHDHSNGGKWEWTGLFSTDEDFYLWTAQKTRHDHSNHNDDEHDHVNAYADAHMKMAVLPASTGTDASSGLDPSRTTAERALALSQRPVRSPRSPAGDLRKERKLKQELKQKTPRVWKKAQAPTPVKAPHRRRQVLYTAELADVPFGAQGVWMPNATLDIPVPMSTEYAGGLTVTTPKALSRSAAREAKEESQIPG